MTNPIRVHQFAKDNSCESKDVLKALHEMGYEEIKTASSKVPFELVEKLKKKIQTFPINEISVRGLWNQTDITLDLTNGLTSIINGPNGVGKTSFLNLIKEIFHNRNFLEETAPLRKTVFKEIKVVFSKLGILTVTKSKNRLVFKINKKRIEVSAKKIRYENFETILQLLERHLEAEYIFQSQTGLFQVDPKGEEIILTDLPKLIANSGLSSGMRPHWHRRRYIVERTGRAKSTMSDEFRILKKSLEDRWNDLDPKLLQMLDSIKITDIPTRRERALNISDFEEQSLLNTSLETVEGISIKLREELNQINEDYLISKNAENAKLGKAFLKNALSYDPIEKNINIPNIKELIDKSNDEKRRKLRDSIDRLVKEQKAEKKEELNNKFTEFLLFELSNSAKWLIGSMTPSIEKFGDQINFSTKAKINLKETGYFYHQVEDEVDFKKITVSSKDKAKGAKQSNKEVFERFFATAFVTPYLKTIAGSNSTAINEMQLFAKKTGNFLNMVNDQYGLLNKRIELKIDKDNKHLIEVRSTINNKEIPLDVLSSGEKHVIILCYLLAFVEKDHLLLIDEPEISMHVEWKENFIGNLNRCLDTTMSKSIIATHSPTLARAADAEEIFYFEPSN